MFNIFVVAFSFMEGFFVGSGVDLARLIIGRKYPIPPRP